MKKLLRFEIIITVLILSSHIFIAVSPHNSLMNWFRTDDAFYYFQTARNISQGLGITFDGINLTNGFHPLWMLVCIPVFSLARFDLYLPFRILIIILGILNAASAVVIYRWLYRILSKPVGIIGAIIWAFNPTIHALTSEGGLETGLSTFLILLLLSKISSFDNREKKISQITMVGLIASLVFLARLDNIFLLLFLGLWVVFLEKKLRNNLALDATIIFLSGYTSLMLRIGIVFDLYVYSIGIYTFIFLSIIIKIPLFYLFGLYRNDGSISITKQVNKIIISLLSAQFIISIPILLLLTLTEWFSFPRSVLIIDLFISAGLLTFSRIISYYLSRKILNEVITPKEQFLKNWRGWVKSILAYYGFLIATISSYIVYNYITFQTSTPVSGQIKQWWGKLSTIYGTNVKSISDALGGSSRYWKLVYNSSVHLKSIMASELFSILLILSALVIIALIFKNRNLILNQFDGLLIVPLLAGALWQIWTYNIRSYIGFRDWYWISQDLLIFLGLMLVLHYLFNVFSKPFSRKVIMYGTLLFISTWIGLSYFTHLANLTDYSQDKEGDYLFGVSFLEENTQPGSIIGMTGGGTTAYFLQNRTIVNLDGLINSNEYFKSLKEHTASEFLSSMGLQYVFAIPYVINESSPYKAEFSGHIHWIGNYQDYSIYSFKNP
jgi:hypothetical protein